MALCSYALKLGEEALGTLGRFGSRFHFLAVARQEVPGALTSEPREAIPVSNSTREHASHTSSLSRMAAHWFALKPCEEQVNCSAFLLFPHSRHAGGYWRCSGLPRNPFSTLAFTKGHFTLYMPEEAARKVVCFPVSRSMAFTNSFPSAGSHNAWGTPQRPKKGCDPREEVCPY